MANLAIVHEHPEWQKPLFEALMARDVAFDAIPVRQAAFWSDEAKRYDVVFNQATPSAYTRGFHRAVPHALALLRSFERQGARVLNGSDAFLLELSKAAQVGLCRQLDVDHPRSLIFNDVEAALAANDAWPKLLKPDMGGSGAKIQVVDDDAAMRRIFENEAVWEPDHLFLLQEYLSHDPAHGIVRLEYVGGEFLYGMRVVTHGRYNLCPSVVCNPAEGGGVCEIPTEAAAKPVEFHAYKDAPDDAIETGARLLKAANIDVGAVEYLETPDGRRVFYDINANSNLRLSIGEAFGFNPFERVAAYLAAQR